MAVANEAGACITLDVRDLATATNVAGHVHMAWRLVVSLCCLEAVMVKSDE